jgi:transposase
MKADLAQTATREELIEENTRHESEIARLGNKIVTLEHHLSWLERQIFGSKSERFIPNDQQTELPLGGVASTPIETQQRTVTYQRTELKQAAGHGRSVMPTHLPVKEQVIEPAEDVSGCVHIGDEISWEYEYEPGTLFIKKYIRRKYALPQGDGIAIGDLPTRVIPKGNFGPGLISRLLIDKYVYHLPFDRQRRKYKSEFDVDFAESTLCDVARQVCEQWISPLYKVMIASLLKTTYLMADETPLPVLIKTVKGKTHRGYLWVYYDPLGKMVVFDYRHSRSRDGPNDFLKNFSGTLQIDGYEGYTDVNARPDIVVAGCMAHVRRYFEQAMDSDRKNAEYALQEIGNWFEVERQAAQDNLSHDERLALRKEKTVTSMDTFEQWMKNLVSSSILLPKSPMGKAVGYAQNMWPRFAAFKTDGRIELSNNFVENAIRPVAIGRKNWMFAGSEDGAQRSAMFYSVVCSAQLHGIDPFEYVRDLLIRLPDYNQQKLADLLPVNWKNLSK